MAKRNSPAFNFYSSDFLTETTFFTLEQTGAYIKLLCYQHQFTYLTKEQIMSITTDQIVLDKFVEKNGKFYNKNLKEIIDKKKAHCEKQRANAMKRWGKNDNTMGMPSHTYGNAMAMPLENEIEIEKENKNKKFIKPTIEDIKKYCLERNNKVDANSFYDFYESKGWKVGNQAMKDWKACVRTWERRSTTNEKRVEPVPSWFNQEVEERKLTEQEKKDLDGLLKEFK